MFLQLLLIQEAIQAHTTQILIAECLEEKAAIHPWHMLTALTLYK